MAYLYVVELNNPKRSSGGRMDYATARQPLIPTEGEIVTSYRLTIDTVTVSATTFNANTQWVRLVADVPCHFVFGTTPGATSPYLPAGISEDWDIDNQASNKISCIEKQS